MLDPVVLEVRNACVSYGNVAAVRNVSMTVQRGELAALLGPSGCGKTSLLRAIAGFEPLDAGTISIDGSLVSGDGCNVPPEKRQVGLLFQNGALFPHMTVWENVRYGALANATGVEHAQHALELVGLRELRERYPDELSGGQQQRVALARAVAARPKIILLDEPFANLDAVLRNRLRDEVRDVLRREQITALLVTHDQDEALSSADRVLVMHQGSILQLGRPDDLYRAPACVDVARFVGDGQILDCRVESGVVETDLGSLQTDAISGDALLLVRPEQIRLGAEGTDRDATVIEQRYQGHDRLVTVRLLESGSEYLVRVLSDDAPQGTTVSVKLRDSEYRIFAGPQCVPFVARPL